MWACMRLHILQAYFYVMAFLCLCLCVSDLQMARMAAYLQIDGDLWNFNMNQKTQSKSSFFRQPFIMLHFQVAVLKLLILFSFCENAWKIMAKFRQCFISFIQSLAFYQVTKKHNSLLAVVQCFYTSTAITNHHCYAQGGCQCSVQFISKSALTGIKVKFLPLH